jgi:hypothetical protein
VRDYDSPSGPETLDLRDRTWDIISSMTTLKGRGVVGVHVRWDSSGSRGPVSRWEEAEEIEFVTTTGIMQIKGMQARDGAPPPNLTYQGAGRYGLRVHGRARPGSGLSNRPGESYLLVVWPIALGA